MLDNPGIHCASCVQYEVGVKRLGPDGMGTSGVLIVGDSPWTEEIRIGKVFVGPAGNLLNRAIRAAGREREEFIVANSMWCKPPTLGFTNSNEGAAALATCRPYLDELIASVKPRCIVPMGNVALGRICDVRGIEKHHSYVHETPYGLAVPTFHPSFLIQGVSGSDDSKARNLRYFPAMTFALQRALEVAQGKFTRMAVNYLLDPRLEDARAYVAYHRGRQIADIETHGADSLYCFSSNTIAKVNNLRAGGATVPGLPAIGPLAAAEVSAKVNVIPLVFIDLETPESSKLEGQDDEPVKMTGQKLKLGGPIIRCSLSLWPGTAISFPWEPPWIEFTKEVLSNVDSIAAWNGYDADFPKLVSEGIIGAAVRGSGAGRGPTLVDPMWSWHFLQSDLPKALGFVAPFFYDGPAWKHLSGSDPAYYNAVDSDAGIRCLLGIRQALVRQGRWSAFTRHCTETAPILKQMGEAGILVDRAQQSAFQKRLGEEYQVAHGLLQTEVPDSVRPRKTWKRPPKDMAGVVQVRTPSPFGEEQGLLLESAAAGTLVSEPVYDVSYSRLEPFNPHSTKQVGDLIRHFGLKMPIKRGTDRETTESKYLRRFARKKGQGVFRRILDCRERQKMLSTYIWDLDAVGRVHTTYNWTPSTWRKASRDPNLQNIPKRNEIAKEFRRMITAAPGCVLIAGDSSAIEAVLVGYSAGSEAYIRLSKAGVHDWLAGHLAGCPVPLELPFDELRARLKEIKLRYPDLRERCKRVIHGSNYMLTAFGIYDEYAEDFTGGKKQAQELQDLYFSLLPGQDVKRWQRQTMERAHAEHYLDNHFGGRHYFYDVFAWDKHREQWGLGSDAKRAVAFGPQSDASFIQDEILLDLASDLSMLSWLRLVTHDEVVAEVPKQYETVAVEQFKSAMSQPWPQLGGLSIGVEVKVGPNLADMETV